MARKTEKGGWHFVHVFASFEAAGVPLRIVTLINHFGARYRHTIIALDGRDAAKSRLCADVSVRIMAGEDDRAAWAQQGSLPARLWAARRTLEDLQPDLLLTYNWGSVEWALANRFAPLCRHVHLESGFSVQEATRQLARRIWFRRLALGRIDRLIVPSLTLQRLAVKMWRFAPERLCYIPNGVDCALYGRPPKPEALEGVVKKPGEVLVGTLAPLRPEKNIARLLRAFATVARDIPGRLVIIGDGMEKPGLERLAGDLGLGDQVVFAGHAEEPAEVIGLLDVFALSSDTEQMPNSLNQAMAAGLAVVATDVGDVKHMLSADNRPFVVARDDEAGFADALRRLADNPEQRARLGAANRRHVRALYDQRTMFDAYEAVFEGRECVS
jgi:glycosyltransferase involved in cell wall biosynthesis